MDAQQALSIEQQFKRDALNALSADFAGYTCATSTHAYGFLSAKLFSRFGGLSAEVERATIAGFRNRNLRAGLRTFSNDRFCAEYAGYMCGGVEYEQGLVDATSDDMYATYVKEAALALNSLRFMLRRWSDSVSYDKEISFDFVATGPGSTGQVSNNTSVIAKLYWHDQTVGSVASYKRYVNLLKLMTGELSCCLKLEHARVRSYETTVKAQQVTVIAKNETSGRIIMPQNGIDLFCQKELGSRMTRALRSVLGVSLSSAPDLNADAARRGSLDNSISTIDLRSASDFPLSLIHFLLTPEICHEIRTCRNTHFRCRGDKRDSVMHIVAGMGNDFCFPLQTAIFTSIARTACIVSGESTKDCRSFGDDIVVPAGATGRCLALLHALSFEVNDDKSFTSREFVRESCGGYYHQGRDIRPFRVDGLGRDDLTVALNALVEYSAGTGFVLKNLYAVLLAYGASDLPVPLHADPRTGLRVPIDYRFFCTPERFNHVARGNGWYLACVPTYRGVSQAVYKGGDAVWLKAANVAVRLNVGSHKMTHVITTESDRDDAAVRCALGYSLGYTRPRAVLDAELVYTTWDYNEVSYPFEDPTYPQISLLVDGNGGRKVPVVWGYRNSAWRQPLHTPFMAVHESYKTSRALVKSDVLAALIELGA